VPFTSAKAGRAKAQSAKAAKKQSFLLKSAATFAHKSL
jgi:hypothetical protein